MTQQFILLVLKQLAPELAMFVIVYVSATRIIKQLQMSLQEILCKYDKLQKKIQLMLTEQIVKNERIIEKNTSILKRVDKKTE